MNDVERFWPRVNKTETCWLWTGGQWSRGYGRMQFRKKPWLTHRIAYTLIKGEIPDGLFLDHLCRVPLCCNPDHLEAVTNRVNMLRGVSPVAQNAKKTHCIRGHEFTAENTYLTKKGRHCRACKQILDHKPSTVAAKRRGGAKLRAAHKLEAQRHE